MCFLLIEVAGQVLYWQGSINPFRQKESQQALDPEGVIKRAEIEIVLLKERPNFKPEQFIDDRFYKAALKVLAGEPGAKK